MSIYALPGPLCDLVSSGISALKLKPDSQGLSSSGQESSSSSTKPSATRDPLHKNISDECEGDASESSSSSDNHSNNSNSNVVIAVKEATIDPARLIRSLTTAKPDAKKAGLKTDSTGESAEESSKGKVSQSSTTNRRRRRSKNGGDILQQEQDNSESSVREYDPHEEAVKIEISVSCNGREYTATRTLPRILQFRCDLIEEFRARRKFEERKKKSRKPPPKMAPVYDLSDDEDDEEEDSSLGSFKEDAIPEIPRLADDSSAHHHAGGNQIRGGGGFSVLNALLRPYGPALERWLRKVIDVVPSDSQCLSQFLWEPLSGGHATNRKFERRNSSLSTLGAIQEADSHDPYDSDCDSDTSDFLINC